MALLPQRFPSVEPGCGQPTSLTALGLKEFRTVFDCPHSWRWCSRVDELAWDFHHGGGEAMLTVTFNEALTEWQAGRDPNALVTEWIKSVHDYERERCPTRLSPS